GRGLRPRARRRRLDPAPSPLPASRDLDAGRTADGLARGAFLRLGLPFADKVPVERQSAIDVRGFRHGEPRDEAVTGPGKAVVAPYPRRSALKKMHGSEIARIEQRDEIAADGAHILDGDDEAVGREPLHPHAVDDISAGAILALHEVEF